MLKLKLCVLQNGYTVNFGDDVGEIQLDGGLPRTYIKTKRNAHAVNIGWTLNKAQYNTMMAFWRVYQAEPNPFLIDLIIDSSELEEYEATFVPGSFSLGSKNGPTYSLSAQLRVKQGFKHLDVDQIIIITEGNPEIFSLLDELVNKNLPDALGVVAT